MLLEISKEMVLEERIFCITCSKAVWKDDMCVVIRSRLMDKSTGFDIWLVLCAECAIKIGEMGGGISAS